MTLSQRTILIIVSTFIALLFILATTSDLILLSSYSALEKTDITSHTRHISNHIDDKLKQLDLSAQEVAEHLKKGGGVPVSFGRASRQLFTVHFMRSHSIDLAAVYDRAGRLAAISGFNCEKNEPCPVSAEQQRVLAGLVSRITSGDSAAMQGVVNLAGSPLMVAFKSVRNSKGEKQGVVATGWYVDNVEMGRIFRASGASITVHDLNSSLVPDVKKAAALIDGGGSIYATVIDSASVGGYFMLKDVFGQPSFIVRAVEPRILYEHGKVTIAYIFMALFLAGGVICSVMLLFVRETILTRLQSLTAKVRQITEMRDISERVPLSGHQDELQILAVSLNSMLESLEHAEAEMRESEERYRMLFERAPDSIVIIGLEGDEAGRIVAANQAAADQHGYTVDELRGMHINDLNSAETNKISGKLMVTIASGEWVTTELWHRKKDGTQFPIEVHAGLIKIGGKKYVLGFDRDITQRKITEETDHMYLEQIGQLNDELSRKAIDLAAANNELETFNYSVSHDMRGPLTRISGYCQLLLDDGSTLDPDVREYISRIYESTTWLNDMIDALLHLAQVTRAEIVTGSVNLSAIAEATLKERSLECPDRSVATRIEPDIVVDGDSRLLKMVMINLLDNAWKYSALKDDAVIEFGADRSGPEPVYFVRDNGAGFDMADAGKLFRVFTRLHDSSGFSGTGIGLATVQRIIFRHGGRIWVEAEAGTGATFFFTLP
jgi:PAS domain S-box-containing protein